VRKSLLRLSGAALATYSVRMRAVCVFCGSSAGIDSAYTSAARTVGQLLGDRGLTLVYGGGRVGLMGQVADAALTAGAHIVGVIPEALQAREVAHLSLPDLRVVASMHERKALMAQLADAFVALPGGAGTLEEFFEVWTWALLGIHRKPCGILNVAGYFDGLLTFIDHSVAQQFVRPEHRAMVLVDDDPGRLFDRLASYAPPAVPRWLGRGET
jgi:uncharacterized protein (TIGR00730 family)